MFVCQPQERIQFLAGQKVLCDGASASLCTSTSGFNFPIVLWFLGLSAVSGLCEPHLLFQPIVALFGPQSPDQLLLLAQSSSGSTITFSRAAFLLLLSMPPFFDFHQNLIIFLLLLYLQLVYDFTPCIARICLMFFLVRGCTPSGLGLCLTTVLSFS